MQIICSRQRDCSCGFNPAFLFSRFRLCGGVCFRTFSRIYFPLCQFGATAAAAAGSSQRSCRDARCVCPTHALPAHWYVLREDGGGSKPTSSEEDLRLSPAPPHIPQMTQASDSGADVSPTASGSPRPNRLHNTTQLNTASSDLWSSTSLCTFSSPLLRHPRRVRSILLHLCSPRANSTNPTAQRGHGRCRSSFGASGPVVLWRKSTTKPSEPAWSLPLVSLVPIAVAYSLSPPTSPRTQGDTCSMQDPHAFAFAIAIETPTVTAATTTIHRGCRR